MYKVFLGGTCAQTTWRDTLVKSLKGYTITFFNPVVADWTLADKVREDLEKKYFCPIHLYVLTSEMKGVYSVAEAVQSSVQPGIITIVQILPNGFDKGQMKSLEATLDILNSNGAHTLIADDIDETAKLLKTFTV